MSPQRGDYHRLDAYPVISAGAHGVYEILDAVEIRLIEFYIVKFSEDPSSLTKYQHG